MKKGQTAEGLVVELKFPNKAIVKCENGELCVVKGALPGQRVHFRSIR